MIIGNLRKVVMSKRRLTCQFLNIHSSTSDITAGILIIGDEILNGHTEDTNSTFLIKNLNIAGLKICKIAVLPDNVDAISEEVSALSKKCSVVLTSGGIGPTHDDVTYQAVARAFSEDLVLNEELFLLLRNYFGLSADQNSALKKFSSIPQSAILNFGIDKYGARINFPLMSVKNVYMFPGIPVLLQKSFNIFKTNFLLRNKPHYMKSIFLALDEFSVTPVLNDAVNLFSGRVKFGSYPSFNKNYFKVKLVLESLDENFIAEACDYFKYRLPGRSIVNLKEDLSLVTEDLLTLCKSHPQFASALLKVEETLKKYSLSELCFCFNGGKGCTALLHLLYCCVLNTNPENWSEMLTLYVKNGDTFREVNVFVEDSIQKYHLNMVTVSGDLNESFGAFMRAHPCIKAFLMGTRRGDPGAENIEYFYQSDPDLPSVVRVFPILDWSYADVWTFIRSLQVPYCSLYDQGYTSFGLKSQTVRNPALLIPNQKGFHSYKPAYMLKNITND